MTVEESDAVGSIRLYNNTCWYCLENTDDGFIEFDNGLNMRMLAYLCCCRWYFGCCCYLWGRWDDCEEHQARDMYDKNDFP